MASCASPTLSIKPYVLSSLRGAPIRLRLVPVYASVLGMAVLLSWEPPSVAGSPPKPSSPQAQQTPAANPVPKTFFSMHMHSEALRGMPWPAVGFGGIRLWDTRTNWNRLNPSRGVYDWAPLDAWLDLAEKHGVDVLYAFGGTPVWASSKPNAACEYQAGACYPPADMQDWENFVYAIATHAAGRIEHWELWNEPNLSQFWSGGTLAMANMAQRAYRIIKSVDPTAIVLTPSPSAGATGVSSWLDQYFAAGGGAYADIVAFHGYPSHDRNAAPEYINEMVNAINRVTSAHGQSPKPVWDTESSWGRINRLPDIDLQAAYVARSYILHWSQGIERFYWYNWNNPLWGTLWDTYTSNVLKPGIAYGEVYKWLVAATLSSPCSMASDSTWTCTLTRPGGYEAEIVWNSAVAFPRTLRFTPSGRFAQYRDLDGNATRISGATIPIGSKPILLEPFTAVSLSQPILKFGPTPLGVTSGPRIIVVTNAGNSPLLISGLETTGDYRQTNTCGDSVAIGTSCEVSVAFAPTEADLRTGTLLIQDNAPDSPHTVVLNDGTPAAPVVLSPTDLSFSGQVVGAAAISKNATLINLSEQALTISGVEIEGATEDDFIVSGNTCARTIESGASCLITVTFSPTTTGLHTANLTVVDNLSASPRTVPLTGQGWDFTMNMRNRGSSVSSSTGQISTYDLDIVPQGGFLGQIALLATCYNVLEANSCVASPGSVSLTGSSTASFTVTVGTAQASSPSAQLIALMLFLVLICCRKPLRKRIPYPKVAAVALLLLFLAACAGLTGSGGNGPGQGTPAIVVTASSRGVTRTLSLPVSVP